MYLKKLILTNFRKYPKLEIDFKVGLNVLIGENDQGKTSIIDAIRYLLNTKSNENFRYDPRDFHQKSNNDREDSFEIVGTFSDFKDEEAANFLEWGYFNKDRKFELRVLLKATLKNNNRIIFDLKSGPENAEIQMDGNARELLKVTYLKPLRDAEAELTPGYKSRLAQILQSHEAFRIKNKNDTTKHRLVEIVQEANKEIVTALNDVKANSKDGSPSILEQINSYLNDFQYEGDTREAEIKISDPELHRILRSLGLEIENNISGLGTLNKLFMAAELLHLETDPNNSLRLCLIEELEAHLHPQAQLRVINTLSSVKNTQFIVSTHSTTLGASVNLDDLILCHNGDAYPMWHEKTQLASGDRKFLQRFLDATKANLFFARGIILVEGDAENILVPTLAEIIDLPLHKYGVSVVNVGSTAFARYAKIFNRNDDKKLNIPVAVITDLDIKAIEHFESKTQAYSEFYKVLESKPNVAGVTHNLEEIENNYYTNLDDLKAAIKRTIGKSTMPNGVNDYISDWKIAVSRDNIEDIRAARQISIRSIYQEPVKAFINTCWTLEYDLALSAGLRRHIAQAILIAQKIKSTESFYMELFDSNDRFAVPSAISDEADHLCIGKNKYEIAYTIFKPFLSDNPPSKAVTAQILSEILIADPTSSRAVIEGDPYIAYLISAIKYACGK